ncbi:Lacal_2735 family protein [Polaribacter sp.]|uniref:Lacal_2735 family protein n=1 Tax=Polaribacter sp. TaxID=1920175 RepID=UPI004047C1D0
MFGLFKKKSEVEKLHEDYKKIMQEAYQLQSINRSESDQKYVEADNILNKIKLLEEKK